MRFQCCFFKSNFISVGISRICTWVAIVYLLSLIAIHVIAVHISPIQLSVFNSKTFSYSYISLQLCNIDYQVISPKLRRAMKLYYIWLIPPKYMHIMFNELMKQLVYKNCIVSVFKRKITFHLFNMRVENIIL